VPDPSTINSWPAFAAFAVALIFLLALQIPNLVSTIRTRRDARVIREQTENSHANAEHPNLRDELTATREASEAATEAAKAAAEAAERVALALDQHVVQADAWQTSVEDDLSRLRRPLFAWRT
jgi:hypothetical protein